MHVQPRTRLAHTWNRDARNGAALIRRYRGPQAQGGGHG